MKLIYLSQINTVEPLLVISLFFDPKFLKLLPWPLSLMFIVKMSRPLIQVLR